MISGDGVRIILAHLDDTIIGSAIFKEVGSIAYLWGMYIMPAYQRQNIGHGLIRLLVENIKFSTQIHVYVLETSASAIRFYGKMGLSEVSRETIQLSPGLIVNSVLKSVSLDRLRVILNSAGIA
jgi:ribosomal protein S18 acetylase RimI-like enzyme